MNREEDFFYLRNAVSAVVDERETDAERARRLMAVEVA